MKPFRAAAFCVIGCSVVCSLYAQDVAPSADQAIITVDPSSTLGPVAALTEPTERPEVARRAQDCRIPGRGHVGEGQNTLRHTAEPRTLHIYEIQSAAVRNAG